MQQAWLRLHGTDAAIDNLPAWLTTVTVRLCLDRLRQRVPTPQEEIVLPETAGDPAHEVELADTVGVALQVVLDRLTPERARGVRAARQLRLRLPHDRGRAGHHPGRGPEAGLPGARQGPAAQRAGPVDGLAGRRRVPRRGARGGLHRPAAPARTRRGGVGRRGRDPGRHAPAHRGAARGGHVLQRCCRGRAAGVRRRSPGRRLVPPRRGARGLRLHRGRRACAGHHLPGRPRHSSPASAGDATADRHDPSTAPPITGRDR